MRDLVVTLRRNWGALVVGTIVSVASFFLVSGHLRDFLFFEFSVLAMTVLIWVTLIVMDWVQSYLNRSLGKFPLTAREADSSFKTLRASLKPLRNRLILITVIGGLLLYLVVAFVPRNQYLEQVVAVLIALLLNWTILHYYVRGATSVEKLQSDQTGGE